MNSDVFKKLSSFLKNPIILLVLFFAISFFLYGNILNGEFVYDDYYYVDREELQTPTYLIKSWIEPMNPTARTGGGFYRPFTAFSFVVSFILFGENPFFFHLFNTIFYGLVLYFIYDVINRLFKDKTLSIIITSLFAFLPIHSEVVANIKSRDDILAMLFALVSWRFFINATDEKNKLKIAKLSLSAFFFFLGISSKESVILLPFLFLSVWWIQNKPGFLNMLKGAIPYAIALLIHLPLRIIALGEHAFSQDQSYFIMNPIKEVNLLTRISTAFKIAGIYIAKTFVPYNLSSSYDYNHVPLIYHPFASLESILGIIFLLFLTILITYPKTRNSVLGIGALIFIISYILVSKFILPKGAMMAERFMFFPSLGLVLIAGYLLKKVFEKKKLIATITILILLFCYSYITIQRNRVWQDPKTFFENMVKDAPNSVQARSSYARGLFTDGDLNESKQHALTGYEIYPNHPPLLNVLGKLSYIEKDYEKALFYLQKAVQFEPFRYENNHFYALTLTRLDQYKESMLHIAGRLESHPDDSNMRFIMAANLYKSGKIEEAKKFYDWTDSLSLKEKIQIIEEF